MVGKRPDHSLVARDLNQVRGFAELAMPSQLQITVLPLGSRCTPAMNLRLMPGSSSPLHLPDGFARGVDLENPRRRLADRRRR